MGWQTVAFIATVAAPFALAFAPKAMANDTPRISGPAIHDNLAVYFIHGSSAPGPVPLTLREALEAGRVVVHETGSVNTLSIENNGSDEVFVQAGDIVKGGQQDRVLTISFLVPPRSGKLDIGAYCVEQGRWSARGGEDVKKFASSLNALPSRDAKLAMLTPNRPRAAEPAPVPRVTTGIVPNVAQQRTLRTDGQYALRGGSDTSSRQSDVWSSIATSQRKLGANLGGSVAAPASASSMQLTLENEKLVAARRAYVAALAASAKSGDDIVGYVFAISGKLNSGDVYSSNALFGKMWDKQLDAAVTEAIAEKDAPAAAAPGIEVVRAFIASAEAGKSTATPVIGAALVRETREAEASLFLETRRSAGPVIHRSYVAR